MSAVVWCAGTGPDWASQRAAARAVQVQRLEAAQLAERERLDALGQRGRTWEQEVRWRTLQWLPDHPAPATAATTAAAEAFAATPLPVNEHANHAMAAEELGRDPAEALAELAELEVPVLVVRGSEDPRPASGTLAVAEAFRHADLVILEGAGHLPWEDQPSASTAIVRVFLKQAEPAQAGAQEPQGVVSKAASLSTIVTTC